MNKDLKEVCPKCKGTGKINEDILFGGAFVIEDFLSLTAKRICPSCLGTGKKDLYRQIYFL
jgi:DnaJ-class molecular chaperone